MPEGPETHRAAQKIQRAIGGAAVDDVFFAFDALKSFETDLTSRKVKRVYARGKAILTEFTGGLTVYSHNQLYGRWYVTRAATTPKTGRSLRFRVKTTTHAAHLYSASDIEVLPTREVEAHPYIAALGPDPLADGVTVKTLRDRLDLPDTRRKRLGAALLAPGFFAGVGNYLRSEILFIARLHPNRQVGTLTAAEKTRLAKTTYQLMHQSLEHPGITNDLRRAARMKKAGAPRSVYRFWVFRRTSLPCYRCGTPIEKQVVTTRGLFLCPTCQPG